PLSKTPGRRARSSTFAGGCGKVQKSGLTPRLFFFAQPYHTRQNLLGNCDMLSTLRIKNLALVADLTLELSPGYNVITGETGAGKSMLIGALNLVLGQRADRSLIRSGAEGCSVEAVFDVTALKAPLKSFLEE